MTVEPIFTFAKFRTVIQVLPVPSRGVGGFVGWFAPDSEHWGIQLQIFGWVLMVFYCSHARAHNAQP